MGATELRNEEDVAIRVRSTVQLLALTFELCNLYSFKSLQGVKGLVRIGRVYGTAEIYLV